MSERYCTTIKEHCESHNERPFDVCQSTRIEALESANVKLQGTNTLLNEQLAETKELSELRLKSEQKYVWENLDLRKRRDLNETHILNLETERDTLRAENVKASKMLSDCAAKNHTLFSLCGELVETLKSAKGYIIQRQHIGSDTEKIVEELSKKYFHAQSLLSGGGKAE